MALMTAMSSAGDIETLGEALFFDVNLSRDRTQSCATCHSPDHAFIDPRDTAVGRAASLGDDGTSLGDRNAPSAAYAQFSPRPHRNAKGRWVGGLFLDGREPDLEGQAGGPPLNPIEMGMESKGAVVKRLRENPGYVTAFEAVFGPALFQSDETAYAAMTKAIAAFERTPAFAPFDSKYDRFLRGQYNMTDEEELGRVLFFSNQFTNCNTCHQLKDIAGGEGETFSNYEFHNIGVPENTALRAANGSAPGRVDLGLFDTVNGKADAAQKGMFKTPTLRNVAVTGPYMHNGVFNDLRTVILFYNKYNSKAPRRQINPETGAPFAPPEVPENISREELEFGPALKDREIDALVAFLKTLTDQRHEPLIK
ncbi:cytochrome-c peroxidase [Aestuariivirga sp.]|uniref:cytochrome-c peroxidase n=1 Tax=Aestuariivirga sp. TaxID=2650926 RepID=UPI00359423DA